MRYGFEWELPLDVEEEDDEDDVLILFSGCTLSGWWE